MKFNKKTQSEIIVTVLLIIIAIGAMAVLSGFVLNLVKDKMKSGECVKTLGSLSINFEEDKTYFDKNSNKVFLSIEREKDEYNLSGIAVTVGDESISKTYFINPNNPDSAVKLDGKEVLKLPRLFEIYTYSILVGDNLQNVNTIKISPMINNNQICSGSSIVEKIGSR